MGDAPKSSRCKWCRKPFAPRGTQKYCRPECQRAHGHARNPPRPPRGEPRPEARGSVLTCEVDYTEDERVFLQAIDRWKKKHKRAFPSCTEILAVARSLGYRKVVTEAGNVVAVEVIAGNPDGPPDGSAPPTGRAARGASA